MGRIEIDNEEVMVWVVTSDTRDRALPKLVGLWATVRDEIALEAEIAKCTPLTHLRIGAH